MGLLKMIHNPEANRWAHAKALEVLDRVHSQQLILEAYLFGSAAYGNFSDNSDLDIVVVAPDVLSVAQLKKEVYRKEFSDVAIDWIFKTKEDFDARKEKGGVCFVAFNDGIRLR